MRQWLKNTLPDVEWKQAEDRLLQIAKNKYYVPDEIRGRVEKLARSLASKKFFK